MQTERFSKDGPIPKWVYSEHIARFNFSSQFVKNKIIIDCACGTGIGSKMFIDSGAKEVWAFDKNKEEIEKNKKHGGKIYFITADATALPLPDNFADVYISLETIEHIKNDFKYLQEAKRVLKSNGNFICSTPNRTITNPGKEITDKPWNKFHIREYSTNEFINLVSKYFKQIELYGQNEINHLQLKIFWVIGKLLPLKEALLISKLFKLHQFILDSPKKHIVKPIKKNKEYEYLIIVARK